MFEAKRRNSAAVQHYSLNVPSSGSFLYVNVELSKSIIRTKDAFVKLTFKRENVFNLTDSEVLQTFQVNGNGSFVKKIKVRKANVSAPDPSNYLYNAYFDAKGIKVGGEVWFYMHGQIKKM